MSAEIDLQSCEACGKESPIEECTMMEDCWFCAACAAEWQAEFDACEHEWTPHISVMGEEGRCCTRCCGFVANEDWKAVVGEETRT